MVALYQSLSFSLSFPSLPPLPSHTASLRSRLPLIQLGDLGERCKLSQRVRAEPGRQTLFELKNASVKSNFNYTFMKNIHKFDKLKRKFSVYES